MEETYFTLKPITFLNRRVSILLQNENGPCPLLAICNVLVRISRNPLATSCRHHHCSLPWPLPLPPPPLQPATTARRRRRWL